MPTATPEDQARAQLYGLVASLFYAAPDAQLLSALVHAEGFRDDDGARTDQGRALSAAWRDLSEACRSAFPVLLVHEHTELFVSAGRAEVTPYVMHYVMRYDSPATRRRPPSSAPRAIRPCAFSSAAQRSKATRSNEACCCPSEPPQIRPRDAWPTLASAA
jgi:hypothetical protein